jgi:hypothetical protein
MEEYKFQGVPITPVIIEYIILLLFNGKQLKREKIVKEVLDFHIDRGGEGPIAQDFPRSVKKALSLLQSSGRATNISQGYWKINDLELPLIEEIEDEIENELIEDSVLDVKKYGEGKNSVYLYFFDTYRDLAHLKSIDIWPCKIGRTDRDPILRVLSQSSTALPEKPRIEFIIRVDDSALLENMIHSVLKLKNRKVDGSPGTEWFNTNPKEVLDIVSSVNPQLLTIK